MAESVDDGTGWVAPSRPDNDYKNQLGKPVLTNLTHSQRDSNWSKELPRGPKGVQMGASWAPAAINFKKMLQSLYL